jgi:hypothetical protein
LAFQATFTTGTTSTAIRRALLTLLIGGLVLTAAWASRAVASTVEQLGLMGFDEPRSHLIAALLLGSSAAAAAVLITGHRAAATLLGLVGLICFFGPTLSEETTAALHSTGLTGTFDPLGYAFSIFTFVLTSLLFAWAAAALALEVRRSLLRTWRRLRASRRTNTGRRFAIGRVVSTLALALIAAFTLFAQMIDYTPDIAFVRSAPVPQGGLTGGLDLPSAEPSTPTPTAGSPAPGLTPTPSPGPTYPAVSIEAGGTLSLTPGAVADLKHGHFTPRPGTMKVDRVTLPAPWTSGSATTVDVYVSLPAGYDPAHQRYPAAYLAPTPYKASINDVGLHSSVETLEAAGDLPPMIYIFPLAIGGPYAVTQCIDSKDGRQQWDTFMSSTLISWVDSHYATIADPAARTIIGSSQAGYCSADLLLRHPDVWHQEISFSGFYDAAPRNVRTVSGGAVFGGDEALMDAYSPIKIAPRLPVDTRQHLFFVLAGLSSQDFFGPEMDRFSGILDQNGYARAVIESPFGHSSKTVETYLPRALSLIAARMVQEGVIP